MKMQLDIIGGLRRFNRFFDAFILEVAKPLAILGFTMGTVDIYTRGGLAVSPLFAVPWSVVQALTIDGLFFAVWWRFFAAKWTWKMAAANIGLFTIGLVLAVVATATNMILGFQQLWGVSDSQAAMVRLSINPVTFTVTMAVLVVAVTIMVSFTYFKSHQNDQARPASDQSGHENGQVSGQSDQQAATVVNEVAEVDTQRLLPAASSTTRETIAATYSARVGKGEPATASHIAKATGIPRSTVRRHLAEVRKELGA